MDTTKKPVVEPPKSAPAPVKAQPQTEHKGPEPAKPGGSQPKAT
jgi:hypothetical protein